MSVNLFELAPTKQEDGGRFLMQLHTTRPIYAGPKYGIIKKSLKDLEEFVKNFTDGKRDVMMDYDHFSAPDAPIISHKQGEAAGWLKKMFIAKDPQDPNQYALMGEVEAAGDDVVNGLKAGKWKYISPEYADQGRDDSTGSVIGNVLKAIGLTNRPLIKGMQPAVALSERADKVFEQELKDLGLTRLKDDNGGNEGSNNDKKFTEPLKGEKMIKIAEALGLPKDATEEQVLAKLAENSKKTGDLEANVKQLSERTVPEGSVAVKASELAELKTNAAAGAEAAKKLHDRDREEYLLSSVKRGKLASAALEKTRGEYDKAESTVRAIIDATPENTFQFSEIGSGTGVPSDSTAHGKAMLRAKELMAGDKTLSETAALEKALNADPTLAELYRQESYVTK